MKRLNIFKELRQSIQTLWRELEAVPSTTVEQDLGKDDAETTFKLSSLNIEALKDLNCQVRQNHFPPCHKRFSSWDSNHYFF